MTGNSFGQAFRVTTFGESHGPALGCVVDGCPPQLALSTEEVQQALDKRRPGARYTTPRKEPDKVEILSGVFEGKTTGTPIALLIHNRNARSQDYAKLQHVLRPGHGDYTYWHKYGHRDHRGGGRASARETVARVAAGAIARKYLATEHQIQIQGFVSQIGPVKAQRQDLTAAATCPFRFADPAAIGELEDLFATLAAKGDSVGAKLGCVAENVPVGLGEPVFDKLDADLCRGLMSINAVKGVGIGAGFACCGMYGSEFRDPIGANGFASNRAGGTLAGLSSGQALMLEVAFKPTSSIKQPINSVDTAGSPVSVAVTGRHDPCVGIRAVPIVEAMVALVLMDHLLRHRGQNGPIG